MNHPRVLPELAQLLADSESAARAAGAPLLLFKVLSGDEDPQVLHECFAALLRLDPESSMPFVSGYLTAQDPRLCEAP